LFLPFVFIDNGWLRESLPAWGSTIEGWAKALGAISGVISGFVAVLGGKSAAVRLDISNAAPKSGSTKAHESAVRLATLLFIAFLLTALEYGERVIGKELSAVLPSSDLNAIARFVIPRLGFLALFVPIYLRFYFRTGRTLVFLLAVVMLLIFSTIGLTGE